MSDPSPQLLAAFMDAIISGHIILLNNCFSQCETCPFEYYCPETILSEWPIFYSLLNKSHPELFI